ncbi:hypothetical protein WM40_17160 [Robbsia andropogonis]|uniref:Uncharacterized protein n=1 Tax=Robbsia andropogonis TaxID=28092 RepID=A0A0F5JY24_9BURK|nr:hypothetical protein WM40_17160 [Robbsia andropogonis]
MEPGSTQWVFLGMPKHAFKLRLTSSTRPQKSALTTRQASGNEVMTRLALTIADRCIHPRYRREALSRQSLPAIKSAIHYV